MPGPLVPVGLVLVLTLGTLTVGLLLKHPCAIQSVSGDAFQLCHSDVLTLYEVQEMDRGRMPYLDPCTGEGALCDEYPVLTMLAMRGAAVPATDASSFFFVTAILLAACAVGTAACVHALTGERRWTFLFALAPSLALYAFISWDLIAVALAAAAAVAFVRDRPLLAGTLVGLGTAAKLYPVLLLIPFTVQLVRGKMAGRVPELLGAAGVTWLALNLPFAVAAPDGWWTFFRFSAERPADYNSLWYVACRFGRDGGVPCAWDPAAINLASAGLFAVGAAILIASPRGRDPARHALHLALPLLVLFVLTNKVFSPQYSLWLLPWFAYTLRDLRLFVAFSAADIGVHVTGFLWFGRLAREAGRAGFATFSGVPVEAYQAALIGRAVVLLVILLAWFRSSPSPGARARRLVRRSGSPAIDD